MPRAEPRATVPARRSQPLKPTQRAVLITWLTVLVSPGARADDDPNEAHVFVEAGTARGAALGLWELRQSYSVSLLRLGAVGQGLGSRLTLLSF